MSLSFALCFDGEVKVGVNEEKLRQDCRWDGSHGIFTKFETKYRDIGRNEKPKFKHGNNIVNNQLAKINWQFTKDARLKLKRLYPSFDS